MQPPFQRKRNSARRLRRQCHHHRRHHASLSMWSSLPSRTRGRNHHDGSQKYQTNTPLFSIFRFLPPPPPPPPPPPIRPTAILVDPAPTKPVDSTTTESGTTGTKRMPLGTPRIIHLFFKTCMLELHESISLQISYLHFLLLFLQPLLRHFLSETRRQQKCCSASFLLRVFSFSTSL